MNELGAGLFFADKKYTLPSANSEDYADGLFEICKQEQIGIVIPTVTKEFYPILINIKQFDNLGVKVLVSGYESIRDSDNKLLTSQKLQKAGLPGPKFGDPKTEKLEDIIARTGFPVIVKLIDGRGSRGIKITDDTRILETDIYERSKKGEQVLIQECLPGPEYTVDCLFDTNYNPIATVVRERLETKGGICSKGVTVKDEKIRKITEAVANEFKLQYAACIQYMLDKDKNPKLIEINPRFSGGLPLSIAAGPDLPYLAVQLLQGKKLDYQDYKEGVVMISHSEPIFIESGNLISDIRIGNRKKTILVVAAHPDDPELSYWGTLLNHKKNGDRVCIVILSDGENGLNGGSNIYSRETRIREAQDAAGVLGAEIFFKHLPDGRIRDDVELVETIEKYVREFTPDVVYTHTSNDRHQDHRNCALATLSAARKVPKIYMGGNISVTSDFSPHVFMDISNTIDAKIAALKRHRSQIERGAYDLEAIRAEARFWGSRAGTNYAEAFELNHIILSPKEV